MNFECWATGTWAVGSWIVGSWCPGVVPVPVVTRIEPRRWPGPSYVIWSDEFYFVEKRRRKKDDEEFIIL